MPRRKIAFALDYPTLDEARAGAARVKDEVGVLKVGLELFAKEGPAALGLGRELGLSVFADLKLHDIPETVERAIGSVASFGAKFVTVHASGGAAMLARAVERAAKDGDGLLVLAVTVLTSLDASDLAAQSIPGSPAEHALRLAKMAWSAGVRAFVCSANEVGALRAALGPDAFLVTPGIRPAGAGSQDQKRVATPAGAIAAGADLLVVGRPIRDASDPAAAARAIAKEIESALASRGA
jgi:orotidine-5'-phosphate decarboxylase